MLKKHLCLILSFLTIFQSTQVQASSQQGSSVKEWKEGIYQIFSPAYRLPKEQDKRAYVEAVLAGINDRFKEAHTSTFNNKDMESFNTMKDNFARYEKYLKDHPTGVDMDKFTDRIIQETEEAFVVALVVSIVIIAIVATIIGLSVHYGASGGLYVRRGPPVIVGPRVRRGPFWGPRFRRGPRRIGVGVRAHVHVGRRR